MEKEVSLFKAQPCDGVGDLLSYTDSVMGDEFVMGAWTYGYDTLSRLVTAQAGPNTPYPNDVGCWSYDAFGNRTLESMSLTACASGPAATSWASYNTGNQITATNQSPGGVPFDAAGNEQNDGVNQYLYDAEGRICAVASTPVSGFTRLTGYIYDGVPVDRSSSTGRDAEGTRVAKGAITAWSCDPGINGITTAGNETDYIVGPGGQQMSEYGPGSSGALAWQHTNAYVSGSPLATYVNTGTAQVISSDLHFYLNDSLGTRRAQTDFAGDLEQTCSSLPFGDGESCAPTPTEHLFTGKERDAETGGPNGNDYFGARYYASTMGRFVSPDWSAQAEPVPYAKLDNPQSLNLYAYVGNNPLGAIDADGHTSFFVDGLETPGSVASALLSSGGAIPCPNNNCNIFNQTFYGPRGATRGNPGAPFHVVAGANGPVWINEWGNEIDPGADGTGGGELPFNLAALFGGSAGSKSVPAPKDTAQPKKPQPQQPQNTMSCGGSLAVLAIGAVTTGATVAGFIYAPELEPEIYEGLEGALTIQHLSVPAVAPVSVLVEGAVASWQNCHN